MHHPRHPPNPDVEKITALDRGGGEVVVVVVVVAIVDRYYVFVIGMFCLVRSIEDSNHFRNRHVLLLLLAVVGVACASSLLLTWCQPFLIGLVLYTDSIKPVIIITMTTTKNHS